MADITRALLASVLLELLYGCSHASFLAEQGIFYA
jgi:hypothetical protein